MMLVFGGVLCELALVVWSLTSVGRLCRCGSGADCCLLKVEGLSRGMWVDGVGRREWDLLVGGVSFVLEQVAFGVLYMTVGWVGVVCWRG